MGAVSDTKITAMPSTDRKRRRHLDLQLAPGVEQLQDGLAEQHDADTGRHGQDGDDAQHHRYIPMGALPVPDLPGRRHIGQGADAEYRCHRRDDAEDGQRQAGIGAIEVVRQLFQGLSVCQDIAAYSAAK